MRILIIGSFLCAVALGHTIVKRDAALVDEKPKTEEHIESEDHKIDEHTRIGREPVAVAVDLPKEYEHNIFLKSLFLKEPFVSGAVPLEDIKPMEIGFPSGYEHNIFLKNLLLKDKPILEETVREPVVASEVVLPVNYENNIFLRKDRPIPVPLIVDTKFNVEERSKEDLDEIKRSPVTKILPTIDAEHLQYFPYLALYKSGALFDKSIIPRTSGLTAIPYHHLGGYASHHGFVQPCPPGTVPVSGSIRPRPIQVETTSEPTEIESSEFLDESLERHHLSHILHQLHAQRHPNYSYGYYCAPVQELPTPAQPAFNVLDDFRFL